PKYLDNAENYSCNEKSILECFYGEFQEKHETIIKTPRKYAEIYIGNNKKNYITISYDLFNGQSQHTDKESQISFLHIHQVMQDLDNITNTIEDVDNLIDQTNNE
ncbi:15314_t:CDS:2, partial [Entrophospora sp. SA101]